MIFTIKKCYFKSLLFLLLLNYFAVAFATDSTSLNLRTAKPSTVTPLKLQSNTSTTDTNNQDIVYSGGAPTIPSCPQGYAATKVYYSNSSNPQSKYYKSQTVCTGWSSYCSSSIYTCQCDFQGCPIYCLGLCNNRDRVTYCSSSYIAYSWVNSSSVLPGDSSTTYQDHKVTRVTCSKITTDWVNYNAS